MATVFVDRVRLAWTTQPWLHWVTAYALPMGFFAAIKLTALPSIVGMYADPSEHTVFTALKGMILALCEDAVTTTLLLATLFGLEQLGRAFERLLVCLFRGPVRGFLDSVLILVHVYTVFVVTALWLAPVAADALVVCTTHVRFTSDLLVAYARERDMATQLEVSPHERRLALETAVSAIVATLVFTIVYTVCIDLSLWSPTSLLPARPFFLTNDKALVQPKTDDAAALDTSDKGLQERKARHHGSRQWAAVAFIVIVFALVTRVAASVIAGPVVSAIGLNTTLNELWRTFLGTEFQPNAVAATLTDAAAYVHSDTEVYKLFRADTLFRRTLGFKGPLAFDVAVEQSNLPNVLVIAVESFRFSDSKYLTDAAGLHRPNVPLTPHFDKWAKRGVAFSNMWSSWQTSRSLESLLFAQVPFDSVASTGTTNGRADTPLVGLPQFFKQKGYETAFATGSQTSYDQWDKFLASHGFDTVLETANFKHLAETYLGVRPGDWRGTAERAFEWGVHDDLVFEALGVLLATKLQKQEAYMRSGKTRHPFFMTHYTISSHTPFDSTPKWFNKVPLPDFSPLCKGQTQCRRILDYAKARYFTDMMLGKFLDGLEAKGLLKDMIVVVVGDHGQSPEEDRNSPRDYETENTHVAAMVIAEGRLGSSAGTVVHDAAEHYDLLNTLADIVGVPEEGFVQTGVGRSLKRAVPPGERIVWSNNPLKKMSAVRGRERFVYDRLSNAMALFNTIADPYEQNDLLPTQSDAQQAQWLAIRSAGRKLNAYFRDRWDRKCIAQVDCRTKHHHNS